MRNSVFNRHFRVLRVYAGALVGVALTLAPGPAWARWTPIDSAPLHIARHDRFVTVAEDGSWTLRGDLFLRLNTDAGQSLLASYEFPISDKLEVLKITAIEVTEPRQKPRAVPLTLLLMKDVDKKNPAEHRLFLPELRPVIPFGNLPTGTLAKITYEVEQKKLRIPGLFSYDVLWGNEYPELAGTLTIESKSPLYLDISSAARKHLALSQGRLPNGLNVWKADIRSPLYFKPENELGGILSTSLIPRIQISNQKSWAKVVEVLAPRFATPTTPLPTTITEIVEAAKAVPKFESRINKIIELLNRSIAPGQEWTEADEGFTPQSLAVTVGSKRGRSKDLAFAAVTILRALGYGADVALVWKQSPTEKIWIEETPRTPSLRLFNHALVRVSDRGRPRYFDPTHSVPFGEGVLSDVAGSWALTLTSAAGNFERLSTETPIVSHIKITQNLDLRPDQSIVATGAVKIEGPLSAELKQLYFNRGSADVDPYLRSLLGLTLRSELSNPLLQVNSEDRNGHTFDLNFSYLANGAIRSSGTYRDFELVPAGLTGVPLLASPDRETDVIMARNLTIEVETRIVGGELSDETNTSCMALTSFASIVRETKTQVGLFTISDHIQFKTDRITALKMRTPTFQSELQKYTNCLTKSRVSVGPRPAFERSPVGLAPHEIAALKKPIAVMNLQDVKILEEIATPQLQSLISTKIWLATREMLRRNTKSPAVMLEYANALLETGRVTGTSGDTFLADHVSEAAKLFGAVGIQKGASAKTNRVHATMLIATGRFKEAVIALQNAMTLEKGQARDALVMGQIYMRLGDATKSQEWLTKAATLAGSKSTRLRAIEIFADLRLSQNRLSDFIALYRQAIRESPTNAWTYHEFARKLHGLKQWDLSLENSRRSLEILRFPEAEKLLAETLMKKAASLFYTAPGIVTVDPKAVEESERLALECLKYTRNEELPFRIAGHAAFIKALAGDYGSLIATQSYFSKAIERGANDAWIKDRHTAANQALATRRPIAQVWATYIEEKKRGPAAKTVPTSSKSPTR